MFVIDFQRRFGRIGLSVIPPTVASLHRHVIAARILHHLRA